MRAAAADAADATAAATAAASQRGGGRKAPLKPAPPVAWVHMAQRAFMGCYTKAIVVYDAPFWRERGLSGTAMRLAWDAEHPVQNVYDHSEPPREGAADGGAPQGPPAALVCFLAGDAAMPCKICR